MGRTKKKPGYDQNRIMEQFQNCIVEAYTSGISDGSCISLRQVSEEFGITLMKTRKILITAGVYHTENSEQINSMREQGMSISEIMKETGLSKSSVHSYLPYTKIIYNVDELSLYAERCRMYRKRKQAVEQLQMRSDLKTDYTQRDTERAGQTEKALYLLNTISAITDRGNNAEVRRKKDGSLTVYEVKKNIVTV